MYIVSAFTRFVFKIFLMTFSSSPRSYGGSANTISKGISSLKSASIFKASFFIIRLSRSKPVFFIFSLITRIAVGFFSTKQQNDAPLLRASIPMLPLPAKISRNLLPAIYGEIILKRVSFMRSAVGLVDRPGTALKRRLFLLPAMTLLRAPVEPHSSSLRICSLQSRSPLARLKISASAVAIFVASGTSN